MASLEISVAAGLALGGLLVAYALWRMIRRSRGAAEPEAAARAHSEPLRDLVRRIEAIEAAQAAIGPRLAALDTEGPARMQEIAGALVKVLRDNTAGLDAARAGIDQLRARVKTLERLDDPAEARDGLDQIGARLEADRTQAEARFTGVESRLAEMAERLQETRDAVPGEAVERLAAGLASLETRLAAAENGLAERVAALEAGSEAAEMLTARFVSFEADLAELRGALAVQEGVLEAPFARLAALEAGLAELRELARDRDPGAALRHLQAGLEETRAAFRAQRDAVLKEISARLGPLERGLGELRAAGAGPIDQISAELAWFREQTETSIEQVVARLAPIEMRLETVEEQSLTEEEVRAEAQAVAAQLALRSVAEQTALFSSRLALLEASLPRLSLARSKPEREPAGMRAEPASPESAPEAPAPAAPRAGGAEASPAPERSAGAEKGGTLGLPPRVVSLSRT